MAIWKDIQGYEGLYQVSDKGNVKSLARDVEWNGTISHRSERILKPRANGGGYILVDLNKNGKAKTHQVHRLVAQEFIPNSDNLSEVNHKDEDKTNNCVDNLEWCTHEYNLNYGAHNQRVAEAHRGVYNTKCSIPVDMLTNSGELIRTFPSAMEAERWLRANGFPKASNTAINSCCKGREHYNTSYGFKWRYAKGN